MQDNQIIYGLRPVIEALRTGKQIDRIFLQANLQGKLFNELKEEIARSAIKINRQYVPVEKLDRLTHRQNHQGVVAQLPLIEYHELEQVLDEVVEKREKPFLLMLDGVTDVRNLGAIARSAECAGVNALILPQQSTAPVNQDAIKTSAGALLRLPVCRVDNAKTTVRLVQTFGLKVYAVTEKAKTPYTKMDAVQPIMLIMGSEDKGINPQLLKMADELAYIPMKGNIESLNVSVAAGIALYEVVRQRM